MVAATRLPDSEALLPRFDRVERFVHWLNAALFAVLILTGATLYFAPLMAAIGRRDLVQNIHVYSGIALPVPLALAVVGRWGRGLRADIARFNRWSDDDKRWLRRAVARRGRRAQFHDGIRVGKFNAGQKLNASFVVGLIVVMLGTGIVMEWYHPYPLAWRTGATLVHDWLSLAAVVVIAGHICLALADRESLQSMWRGTIARSWAERHAPGWIAELEESGLTDRRTPPRSTR
ncbi:MAG: cytochrome b/b6 domain-containing protein [Acidimicrobiales bacterium]